MMDSETSNIEKKLIYFADILTCLWVAVIMTFSMVLFGVMNWVPVIMPFFIIGLTVYLYLIILVLKGKKIMSLKENQEKEKKLLKYELNFIIFLCKWTLFLFFISIVGLLIYLIFKVV